CCPGRSGRLDASAAPATSWPASGPSSSTRSRVSLPARRTRRSPSACIESATGSGSRRRSSACYAVDRWRSTCVDSLPAASFDVTENLAALLDERPARRPVRRTRPASRELQVEQLMRDRVGGRVDAAGQIVEPRDGGAGGG